MWVPVLTLKYFLSFVAVCEIWSGKEDISISPADFLETLVSKKPLNVFMWVISVLGVFLHRFLFLLLGPAGKAPQYHEIGRSIATLMTDDVGDVF